MVRFSVHDPFSVCFLELFVSLSLFALRWIFAFLHMPFLFFSELLSPFSSYFSVLSNFLARFS